MSSDIWNTLKGYEKWYENPVNIWDSFVILMHLVQNHYISMVDQTERDARNVESTSQLLAGSICTKVSRKMGMFSVMIRGPSVSS